MIRKTILLCFFDLEPIQNYSRNKKMQGTCEDQGTVLTTLKKAGILTKGFQLLIWLRCASGLHGEVGNLPSIHYVGSGAAGSRRSIATQSQAFFN